MITLNSSPNTIHSSGNENWWSFTSNLKFVPKFNLMVDILRLDNTLYNRVLIPTNPSNLNILNISNIIDSYILPDFNPFITSGTISTSQTQYKLLAKESFEGLYVIGTSSAGTVGTVSVLNNTNVRGVITPAAVDYLNFVGGTSSSPEIYIYSYGTASNGFINSVVLSSDANSFVPISAVIGNSSPGVMIIDGISVYSTGASYSSTSRWALKSDIEYLDYNTTDNYTGYKMYNSTSKFLTNSPRILDIQPDEYATLSYIQALTQSIPYMYVVDNLGNTYSKVLNFATSSVRIDIPTGTKNLNINANAHWYDVSLRSGGVTQCTFPQLGVVFFDLYDGWKVFDNNIIAWSDGGLFLKGSGDTFSDGEDFYYNYVLNEWKENYNDQVRTNYNIAFTGTFSQCRFTLTAKTCGPTYNFDGTYFDSGGGILFGSYSLTNGVAASLIYSETVRYEVSCLNTRWTPFRLCWSNTLGGIDYLTVKYIDNASRRVDRASFDRNLVFGNTRQDRGMTTYKTNNWDEYTVLTDPLTDSEGEWLKELFISPEVFWIRNNELIPITLTTDTYSKPVGLETTQLQFSFRLSRTNR
jgi:hypothetical protein